MKTSKKFYLTERHNPQFSKPYYIKCGQLSKKEADLKSNPLYGHNVMLSFDNELKYNNAIENYKSQGFNI